MQEKQTYLQKILQIIDVVSGYIQKTKNKRRKLAQKKIQKKKISR